MLADDLMAAVFPDAAACLENIPGDRRIPDHPLVKQTVRDCLQEAMDFDGLSAVLDRIHRGDLRLVARDTPEPSLFANEILNAKPYAFLDDAPLEERRAHAVQTRRSGDPASAGDLGALDPEAIDRVRDEARPEARDADELHDALLTAGFLTEPEADSGCLQFFEQLVSARRATRVSFVTNESGARGMRLLVAAERLPEALAIHPEAALEPRIEAPASRASRAWKRDEAIAELLRGRLAIAGPVTTETLGEPLGISARETDAAILALEADGVVLRGRFSPGRGSAAPSGSASDAANIEWCDRALLTRIHRYTLHRLRAEIEPVSAADFMRFLFIWQHVESSAQLDGLDGLREALAMLDGFEAAAGGWERAMLPARVRTYEPQMLDMLCLAGEVGWARFSVPAVDPSNPARLVPATPVALFLREHGDAWQRLRALRPRSATAPGWCSRRFARGARPSSPISGRRAASARTSCGRRLERSSRAAWRRPMVFPACARWCGRTEAGTWAARAVRASRAAGAPCPDRLARTLPARASSTSRRLRGRSSDATASSSDGCSPAKRILRHGAS
jgi:ATP-dependent Lhr-like helicase